MQNLTDVGSWIRVLLAAALVAVTSSGAGQESAARKQDQKSNAPLSVFATQYSCRGMPGSLHVDDLTVLDFTIGTSTIAEVQKRFSNNAPVKLAYEEEAERGICIKNEEGMAAVFATGVMGAPEGTLTAIYLAPVRLVESSDLKCQRIKLPARAFSSKSGIRVGATSAQVSKIVRANVPTSGSFCAAYEVASKQGPLKISKEEETEGHDFTGAEGDIRTGKLKWVKLFGIASD